MLSELGAPHGAFFAKLSMFRTGDLVLVCSVLFRCVGLLGVFSL